VAAGIDDSLVNARRRRRHRQYDGREMLTRRSALAMPLTAFAVPQVSRSQEAQVSDGLKLATLIDAAKVTDEDLLFLRQLGLQWLHVSFAGPWPFERIRAAQQRFLQFGLRIHCAFHDSYRSTRLQLGQPGRDEDIATFQQFLRDLGRAGIYSTKIDFHPGNTYTTATVESPRGYRAREFDTAEFRGSIEKRRYDREYSAEEMWANYTYFSKAVVPVAEEANVRLALHPDDPPLEMMNGVAKIFTSYAGHKRAEQIAGSSRHWGLTFCVGTWAEGGGAMGKDIFGMIDDFGKRGRIFAVHFRNVSSTMPKFRETLPDDGYVDMHKVVRALRQSGCQASMIPDHYPGLTGDTSRRAVEAYSIAYMRALLSRAEQE
jgi:mannonate dehydratase